MVRSRTELLTGGYRACGAIHRFGGEEVGSPIKAYPYLGLSAANEADLDAIIDDWMEGQIQ